MNATAQIIRFSQPSEDSLVDGADAATLATINVPASITRFVALLTERIAQSYPDADVRADANTSNGYWAEGFGDPADPNSLQDNIDVGVFAQQLAEELFQDGNAWMVDAE